MYVLLCKVHEQRIIAARILSKTCIRAVTPRLRCHWRYISGCSDRDRLLLLLSSTLSTAAVSTPSGLPPQQPVSTCNVPLMKGTTFDDTADVDYCTHPPRCLPFALWVRCGFDCSFRNTTRARFEKYARVLRAAAVMLPRTQSQKRQTRLHRDGRYLHLQSFSPR